MKTIRFLAVAMCMAALPGLAESALIFGSIKVSASALSSHRLTLTCKDASQDARTDERGSFSFKPRSKGRCALSLTYEGQELTYTVYSQDKPGRYDLEIVREADGKWILRER